MSSEIFVIREDGGLETLKEQPYLKEADLQRLLAEHPAIMPGDQIDPDSPRRWLLVCREAPIPLGSEEGSRGWLDHLFLDQNAVPTLVEVKRSGDTRIRREVVGQMLDYAANAVVYWPLERIRSLFEKTCDQSRQTVDKKLAEFLGNEQDADSFWVAVKTNLQAGRVRLVFVADVIQPELRRIIEFLNEQMDPAEVLGIEVKQFVGASLKTLVPRVIGQTAQTERRKSASRSGRQWNEDSFFAVLEENTSEEQRVARELLQWGKDRGLRISWGKGARMGSFVPVLELNGVPHQLFAVYAIPKGSPCVEIYFYFYASKPPFDDNEKRRHMLAKLNEIPELDLPADSINRRPSVLLRVLAQDDRLTLFLAAMGWYLEEVKAASA